MKSTALALLALALAPSGSPVVAGCLDPLGAMPDGPARAVALDGRTAVVGFGRRLAVVDLSDPSAPVERGSLALPALIEAVDLDAGLALVVLGDRGVVAVDLTQPSEPRVVADLGPALAVERRGSLAYLLDEHWPDERDFALRIVDLAEPSAPALLGEVEVPIPTWTGPPRYLALGEGSELYAGGSTVWVLDVGVPTAPVVLNRLGNIDASLDLSVTGKALVAADWSGSKLFDLTDSTRPTLTAYLPRATTVAASGGFVFLLGSNHELGLHVVDVVDPFYPVRSPPMTTTWAEGEDVAASDGLAVAAYGAAGLWVADVADPAALREVGRLASSDESRWLTASGELMVVAGSSSAPTVWDTTATPPRVVGQVPVAGVYGQVAANGHLLYVPVVQSASFAGIVVVDLSQPAAPVEVGRLATNEPTSVALVGSRLYVVDDDRLLVVDVTDPTSPAAVGELPVWDSHLVVAEGDRLYLGQRPCPWTSCAPGFVVVDASFPDQPREIGHIPDLYPADLAVRAGYAYVVAQYALVVVDCTTGTAPEIVARVGLGMNARSVEVVGRLAVVSGYGRVQVVDVGDPRRPFVVASYALPGIGWDVAAHGDVLWVADGDAGIEWLDLGGCGVSAPRPGGSRVGP